MFQKGFITAAVTLAVCAASLKAHGQAGFIDPNFNANVGSPSGQPVVIHAITVQPDGKVLIGGQFESVDGRPAFRIARLNRDGSRDNGFSFVDPDNEVLSIALMSDARIVFAGLFRNVNGREHFGIARVNQNGDPDESFIPTINNAVNSISIQGDAILLGGYFGQVNGVPRPGIARIFAEGVLDGTFSPQLRSSTWCNVIIPAGAQVLAAGQFYEAFTGYSVARLNEDGSVDTNFFRYEPGFNATALAVQPDGKILVHANSDAMRLNADGTLDESFQRYPGPSSHVYSIAVQPDGKIIMAGRFTSYHGIPANHIVRLNTNGSVDTTFTASVNTNINTIALQADGRILIGGEFSSVNGEPRTRIARLLGDNPVLASAKSGTNFILSWPAVYTNFTLEAASAIPATTWTSVTAPASVTSNEWVITNAIGTGNTFFRLSKP